MHAVINLQPCVKVAWEYMESSKARLYPTVGRLIAAFMGKSAAKDYMPMQLCALNMALFG